MQERTLCSLRSIHCKSVSYFIAPYIHVLCEYLVDVAEVTNALHRQQVIACLNEQVLA